MCPAVKKQLVSLYAAFGFKPTKDINVPGYKPKPPEGGSPVPPGADIEESVRKTEVTIKDDEGKETTLTVQELFQLMYAEQKAMLKESLTGYIKDEDSDGQPDDGAIYLNPKGITL